MCCLSNFRVLNLLIPWVQISYLWSSNVKLALSAPFELKKTLCVQNKLTATLQLGAVSSALPSRLFRVTVVSCLDWRFVFSFWAVQSCVFALRSFHSEILVCRGFQNLILFRDGRFCTCELQDYYFSLVYNFVQVNANRRFDHDQNIEQRPVRAVYLKQLWLKMFQNLSMQYHLRN